MASAGATTLSEAASKQLLRTHGVPFVDDALVVSPDEAVAAAEGLGYPVVAKLCGANIAHKTERGLVRLGLGDASEVHLAATELLAAASPDDAVEGILVAPMLRSSRELIAGLHDDEQFGMTVMLGFGGILTEAVADVSIRLVPITRVDATEMIGELSAQRLLGPLRGEPAVDRAALCDVLLALAAAAEAEPSIRSVDLNPLLVVGGLPIAVDALAEVRA